MHMPVLQVRGRGLLDAIVIKDVEGVSAYDVCLKLKEAGLLVSHAAVSHKSQHAKQCTDVLSYTFSYPRSEKHKAHSVLDLMNGSLHFD